MRFTLYSLSIALGFALAVAVYPLGCATPGPVPPAPGPDPVPTDIFDGAILDCSTPERAPIDRVRICLDVANTGACLVELYPDSTPAAIACAVRSESQTLHVQMARGTATDAQATRAKAADAWIREKRLGLRGVQ
jgi:hypothetical protein